VECSPRSGFFIAVNFKLAMPHDFPRSRRIAEQLRHELADILWREMKDPRAAGVTLTAVEVTRDLEHAKVWFTLMTGEPSAAEKALQHAAGFLRTELAHRMRMRVVPKLAFHYDESVARGAHLSELIDQAVEEDKRHQQDD
jgi:ribosome-binding factor A